MANKQPQVDGDQTGTFQAHGQFYSYTETRLKSPGAGNYAFNMETWLPALRRVGAGVPAFQGWNPYQPPQYTKVLRVALAGYGGVIAGTIGGTPLSSNPLGLPSQGTVG